MESGTSPHVLRFTGFDHRRRRRRLEHAFLTNLQCCGDGEVSGSGVSEGVSEAPTFTEWSTMVVPTYPEGGSHALQVCQHHHQVVRVGRFVGLSEFRDSKNTLLATAPADSAETFTVRQRAARSYALYLTVKVAGGGPSVHACAVFFRAKSRHGDKFNQTPYSVKYCTV